MMIKGKDLGAHFLKNYILDEYIDTGGNSKVYKVKRNYDGSTFALKYLTKAQTEEWTKKRKLRFKDEIQTLKDLNQINNPYVMPLIDYNISDDGLYWYIMPIGKIITEFFNDENINIHEKLTYFIEIAKGIKSIHDLDYYHRDIKPNNILVVENKIMLADFGLVWHPSFEQRTNKDEKIGPAETIAPEMREDNPELKHSSKADIYSFVKTIWMLMLGRSRAFVDQYSYETKYYLDCRLEIFRDKGIKTFTRLNELIMKGTEYTPINRPSIDEVIKELELFILDNNLSDGEIAKINEDELIKRSLHLNRSDIEIYTEIIKIRLFLDEILQNKVYSFVVELLDKNYEAKFRASKIQLSEIEDALIFVDSYISKRYLVKVSKLEIDKRTNKIILYTDKIEVDSLPFSNIYEYIDFNSINMIDRLLGGVDNQNKKSIVEVISNQERFVIRMDF